MSGIREILSDQHLVASALCGTRAVIIPLISHAQALPTPPDDHFTMHAPMQKSSVRSSDLHFGIAHVMLSIAMGTVISFYPVNNLAEI